MKRSEINAIIRGANLFISKQGFLLPPFAYWSTDMWATKGGECREIVDHQLGWDITDFGSDDFSKIGLFLFTIRNGSTDALKCGEGKVYAEKIMIVEVGQITPMHYHWNKTEDIINRGGGKLVIQVYNSTADDKLADTDVTLSLDGVLSTVKAGGTFTLTPGESITLPRRSYHKFWGADERTLVGEISVVNDDNTDNNFFEAVGRFPTVEEDEPPLYLLTNDYRKWLPQFYK